VAIASILNDKDGASEIEANNLFVLLLHVREEDEIELVVLHVLHKLLLYSV